MKQTVLLALLIVFPLCLSARQGGADKPMSDAKLGEGLYQQHCMVCHGENGGYEGTRYGPWISKETVVSEGYVRKQIMDGGQRMPGFKYKLQPAQITLIIAYLKTVDPQH